MKKETLTQTKWHKFMLPLFIAFMAILLFAEGFGFGKWLFERLH